MVEGTEISSPLRVKYWGSVTLTCFQPVKSSRVTGSLRSLFVSPDVEEGELIAGAVAVNPEVQSGIVVGQVGKASAKRNGQPLCIRAEGVIQLSGIAAPLDIIAGMGAGDLEIGTAGEDQFGIFKVLYRLRPVWPR